MQGDAEGNYTVVALLDDADAGSPVPMSMQAIGYFQQSPTQDLPVLLNFHTLFSPFGSLCELAF
jgi:guanylate cyclase, other